MLTDLDIYYIALDALQKEYEELMEEDTDRYPEYVKDELAYELTNNIIHVSLKIKEYVRRSKSECGLDDYYKR